MTKFRAAARVLGLLGGMFVLAPAAGGHADAGAIVVVLETAGPRVDAASIRHALSERLGVPMVSLLDARARSARGVLSIVIDETGRRASVQYRPEVGIEYGAQVTVEAAAARSIEWVVTAAAGVVQASDRWAAMAFAHSEILDPWDPDRPNAYLAASDPRRLPPEVIDPFAGTPPGSIRVTHAEFYLPDEVLDPWASAASAAPRASGGPGRALSRPTPGSTSRPAR